MKKATYHAPSEGFFEFANVKLPFRKEGTLYRVKFMENLSEPMNYEKRMKFNSKNYSEGNPIVISAPDFTAIVGATNPKRDAEFCNFLFKNSRNYWRAFSTAIEYTPKNFKDRIIHYEGVEELETVIEGNYVGSDGELTKLQNEPIFRNCFGKTRKSLEEISQKINKTAGYLWRVNSNSGETIKRQAELDACPYRLIFYAVGLLSGPYAGFRVVLEEQN